MNMSPYADSSHAYVRTVDDWYQERRCWRWRCDQVVLAKLSNSRGGDDGGEIHSVVGGLIGSALCLANAVLHGA